MLRLIDMLQQARVIPVVVIDKLEHALPLANTLLACGFNILEITLRTNCALDAIRLIVKNVPQIILGAGTIITPSQLSLVKSAGVQFAVSPGLSKKLVLKANEEKIVYFPGITTVSEALFAYELGFTHLKFFPAESSGGLNTLSAITAVLPSLQFFPTGGISIDNFIQYLNLPKISCVGGTWIAPHSFIEKGNFKEIALRAKKTQQKLKKI